MSFLRSLLGKAVKEAHISEAATALVDSLRTNATEWTMGEFELHHKQTKADIWIANEDYGLKVAVEGERWVPNGAERAMIWDAAKDLMDARGHAAARKLAAKL